MRHSKSSIPLHGSSISISMGSIKATQQENADSKIQSSWLMKLFDEELKDIYWSEKAFSRVITRMIRYSSSAQLIEALEFNLEAAKCQIKRIEQVFAIIDKKAIPRKCEAVQSLIDEADELIYACEERAMRDAGIIDAGQKIEQHEIALYGTLCQFAESLGLNDVVALFEATLEEKRAAYIKFSDIAVYAYYMQADKEDTRSQVN